ncbi:uncharacterized protein MCYG_04905 [Microsporum canis CBS 113480]|uniref:Uncharacterized protein n=1 Tax=Arthroderma otae (strain ATCC MYA-4605 / CBS 113480) TaxID=554155 RepID=C5FQD3_ARTOC|nr:uncharacterized protein MCYG_04905 [Microsporum canis CBS 113480]EEQ32086.1 predicted protein [Microsporum canis CBS 113480]
MGQSIIRPGYRDNRNISSIGFSFKACKLCYCLNGLVECGANRKSGQQALSGVRFPLLVCFVQARVSISGMVWAVPKKARAGDVASPKTEWQYPCDQSILLFSPSCENCGADQAGTRLLTNNLVEYSRRRRPRSAPVEPFGNVAREETWAPIT